MKKKKIEIILASTIFLTFTLSTLIINIPKNIITSQAYENFTPKAYLKTSAYVNGSKYDFFQDETAQLSRFSETGEI